MRLAPIVSILVACLALNAETIQGKVVRVEWSKKAKYDPCWWKLSNVKLLDEPFAVRGNLGMWEFYS